MGTDLTRIGEKARKDPELVFTSLYHHITDIDNLRASYDKLLAHKASGIDGVTKEEYGKHLEENLRDLSSRLKRMGYRPSPKRRTYVPKPGSEKGRPLGISNFEDKIVEEVTKRTLEPIYEAVFEDSSYGYRLLRFSTRSRSRFRIIGSRGKRRSEGGAERLKKTGERQAPPQVFNGYSYRRQSLERAIHRLSEAR